MKESVRLDKYIAENYENVTRSQAALLIETGNCTVNGIVVPKNYKVCETDVIVLDLPEPQIIDVLPEKIPLDLLYEDEWLAVVNKSKNMVVHPSGNVRSGTLVNALMYHCGDSLSGINGAVRPGIVHRLDKDTSGLIVIAKNDTAHVSLSEQFRNRTVLKLYEAVVCGRLKKQCGDVNAPIGRSVSDRTKMCVTTKNSREALTEYEVLAQYDRFAYLRIRLHTGRTHQIRVHMAYIGHHVAGDTVYGKPNKFAANLASQCLHAKKLGFVHPSSGEYMEFESELPQCFVDFLASLESLQNSNIR